MRVFIAALSLLVMSLPGDGAEPVSPVTESLGWMAGDWRSVANGVETEESWLAPKSGLMLGVSRTTRPGAASAFEFLRINDTKDGPVYYSQPGGKPATPFKLIKLEGQSVVFENADHDFPQRILYRREGDRLHARIEGKLKGQDRAKDWEFKKSGATP